MEELVLLILLVVGLCSSVEGAIGVNYGDRGDNMMPPKQVVKLLKSTSITRFKMYDANQEVLAALAGSDIQVTVGVMNQEIPLLARPNLAMTWVSKNIVQHLPATKIRYISVGNEVMTSDTQASSLLLPAMQNLHNALVSFKLEDQVTVSAPQSLGLLSVSFPPSTGSFNPRHAMKPLLEFLSQTKAPLMINAYPYIAYRSSPSDIPLPYALFLPNNGFSDSKTGLVYTNLLSAQIDAVYFAMEKLNYRDVEVLVSETGWPSVGDVGEVGVSVQNAMNYNKNLVSFVNSGAGTPARPQRGIEAYIFSLFNEDLKPGPSSERNFGIFRPDGTLPYDLGLMKTTVVASSAVSPGDSNSNSNSNSSSGSNSTAAAPPPESSSSSSPPMGPKGPRGNITPVWCVAKPNASPSSLLEALNYACGEGGADCTEIQFGESCYLPNDIISHASYAFNSYFVKQGGNKWNCYFGNTAILTLSDPSYGVCLYPPFK